MDQNEKIIFVLGDKLPVIYDVGITIFSVVTSPKSEKMKHCIKEYVNALTNVWVKSFGNKHLMARQHIKKRVETIVSHYYNNVYVEHHRTKPKHKGEVHVKKSIRQLNREWRQKTLHITNRKVVSIDSLLDIGQEMDGLTGNETSFYEDQKGARIFRLSEEIDTEYVAEREQEELIRLEEAQRQEGEESYIWDDDIEEQQQQCSYNETTQMDISLNRSGHVRKISGIDMGTQYDSFACPKIRKTRDCTTKIKATCAEVSVNCNISTEASRVAVKTVCNGLYGHKFYLSKEEATDNDPSLEEYRSEGPKPAKRLRPKEKVPSTKNDYKVYENVLPSARTVNDFKQVLAIQHEQEAASALRTIKEGTKVTLHFDATSRSKIDGDWPCLILIFSDKQRFPLRPLFFAYEDRAQIIRLIIETYQRLAATINTPNDPCSAKTLWEKTTSLMTDSVSKNLQIGEGVATEIESKHVPFHLLCKSHPVEAFDRSNLSVLAGIEKQLKFREKLEAINPAVRSFLRGTSVVECAINSILSLVSHDKSANSTNQADLFDHILQREGQVKHIAMYYERRFTKLGYSAASILQSLPYLRMLLDESHLSNQHIEIVRMFMDSEFLITELHVLAYFTHAVTLPFLYFVEVNSQDELLRMFPLLYKDLKDGNLELDTDTLKDYVIHYPHVKVDKPNTDLSNQILKLMCIDAGEVFGRQAGREYGFGDHLDKPARATQIHLLTKEERAGLPTNNLDSERHLSVFGKRAPVAKFRNKMFTAKGIRNDVTLYHSTTFQNSPSRSFVSIVKLLNNMEKEWVGDQKELHKLKIMEKIEKGKKQSKYTDKCLQLCKSWNGPATSVEELHDILKANCDNAEKIVRIELSYYRDTHKSDILQHPDLFKINNISHDEQLLNLCALLSGNDPMSQYVTLPSNKDAELLVPSCHADRSTEDNESDILVGMTYVTLVTEGDKNTWYLAACIEKHSDETYTMEYLHRLQKSSNLKWKHPSIPERDILKAESIVVCDIDGEWDVCKERNMTFTLRNHLYIDKLVEGILE
jgi:hypothetical protein